jgi:hypothetical protein
MELGVCFLGFCQKQVLATFTNQSIPAFTRFEKGLEGRAQASVYQITTACVPVENSFCQMQVFWEIVVTHPEHTAASTVLSEAFLGRKLLQRNR